MKVWANTKTLDGYIDDLEITDNKNEAEIALLGGKTINLDEFPNLKGIFRAGVSRDNVPEKEAQNRDIIVSFPSENTVDFIYEETASFTCFLILKMLYYNVGTLDPWEKYDRSALKVKQLLVIGKGNIGSKVISKMNQFMNVDTFDIFENSLLELRNKIQSADCITFHIPNTSENKNYFDEEKLSWMKDECILINTARGAIVSEDALYKEISNNRIIAAFDVFWKEPYEGKLKQYHPYKFDMTPHIASTCKEFLIGAADDLRLLVRSLEEGQC